MFLTSNRARMWSLGDEMVIVLRGKLVVTLHLGFLWKESITYLAFLLAAK